MAPLGGPPPVTFSDIYMVKWQNDVGIPDMLMTHFSDL